MANFEGAWNTVTKTPMGDQSAVLTIKRDGNGFTGTSAGSMGTMSLDNGKVEGDHLTWTMNMTAPFAILLEAEVTIDGDKLSGGIKAGAFGTSPISGTRQA